MSTENNTPGGEQAAPVETPTETEQSLDDFSADFFGQEKPAEETQTEQPVEEVDAPETEPTEETPAEEDEGTQTDVDSDNDTNKPVSRFQKRVNELTAARREEERRANELERRLQELEKELKQSSGARTDEQLTDETNSDGASSEPTPADKNADGSDKYPLGEFDPSYIRDQAVFAVNQRFEQERLSAKEAEKATKEAELKQAQDEARNELNSQWETKLETALVRYPDFQEQGQNLSGTFEKLPEESQQYLSETIMSLENGTDVVYHLATNPEEAEALMTGSLRSATIGLGRLDAMFTSEQGKGKTQPTRRVSSAPTPPPSAKGSTAPVATVPDDTDNLDAFEKKFFKN